MTDKTVLGDYVTFQYGKLPPKETHPDAIYPIFTGYRISGYSKTYLFEEPEVIVVARGVGGTGDVKLSPPLAHVTNLSIVLQPIRPINKRFLRDYLSLANLRQLDSGAAQSMITIESLRRFPVVLPPLDVQDRIAEIIARYNDLIETNRRRIALLEESAQLLYREWFVHLRYPGHSLTHHSQALPPSWRIRPLGELATVNRDSLGSQDKPDEIRYIDIASVETGSVLATTKMPFADAPGRARRKVQHGDVIWSCVRPNRRSYALLWQPHTDILVSTGFAVLTAGDVPFSYLYFATTSDEFAAYLTNRATGAAYPAVKARDFEEAPLLCPPSELLQNFHEACLPVLELRNTLMEKNANLTEAHDALLPKLMSGEIQV
jgi:type I restriction enzyme S subunit